MYRIEASDLKKRKPNGDKCYFLNFMKGKFNWMLYLVSQENFKALFEILKKFCVLSNFSDDFEMLGFLGKGHFAEVHSVEKISTKKKFAAKFFKKGSEFEKHSV